MFVIRGPIQLPVGTGFPNAIVGDPNGRPVMISPTAMAYTDANGVARQVTLSSQAPADVTVNNTTITGKDINGSFQIKANNVTIQQCRVTGDTFWVIGIGPTAGNWIIQDCLLDGNGSDGAGGGSSGIYHPNGGNGVGGQALRNNMINMENGFADVDSHDVIKDNYIHQLVAAGSPHYDPIQMFACDGASIIHNTLDNENTEASNINATPNTSSAISNLTINNNLMLMTQLFNSLLIDQSQGSGNFSANFNNNVIQANATLSGSGAGGQGYSRAISGVGTFSFTHSGNVDYVTRQNIDGLIP